MSPALRVSWIIGVLVVVAGCTQPTADPSPSSATAPATTTAAPSTTSAASTTAAVESACDLLTPAQVVEFGSDPSRQRDLSSTGVQRCRWPADDFRSFGVNRSTDPARSSLAFVEASRDYVTVYEPGTVDGYPVIRADESEGDDLCTIYFSPAEGELLSVGTITTPGVPACDLARRVVSAALTTWRASR